MVLARPIALPTKPDRPLLQRDCEIPMDLVPHLKRFGIREVWVRRRPFEFLEDLLDEGAIEHHRRVYLQVRRNFEAILRDSTLEIDVAGLEKAVGELLAFLRSSDGSLALFEQLDAFDNYLMAHSTNVCYLALVLAMNLQRRSIAERHVEQAQDLADLRLLGLGCLMHDMGKMLVSREIVHKPGKLDAREMAEMRRHTTYGYQMVRRHVPPQAAQVVLHHHQRWDGSGYPRLGDSRTGRELPPLAGSEIPIFCRIATVADVYDAATMRRCYSEAKLPVQVLCEMRHQCRGFFDPQIESVFYQTVPPFPIGQTVGLSDGVEAVVVDFHPSSPARPRVKRLRSPKGEALPPHAQEEIDLRDVPELEIAWVDGQDVRPYTACQQSSVPEPALA